jgi:hypothetical protein
MKVTKGTVIQRLNRRLRRDDMRVRTTRGWRAHHDLGRHYIVNPQRNWIVATNIDLEAYGREYGVLDQDEQLAAE